MSSLTEIAASTAQGSRAHEQSGWASGQQSERPVSGGVDQGRLVAHAAALIAERKRWVKVFGEHGGLFGDPFWNILLDLYVQPQQRPVSVMGACIAAECPSTTALRHIRVLIDRGLVSRERNPEDRRVMLISLTDAAKELIARCLSHGMR